MIDLHHHFDGAFSAEELYKEAQRRGLAQAKLSFSEFAERCRVQQDCHSLTDFLAVFDFFYEIAQDLDFLHAAAKSLPLRMAEQGIAYLETRFAPDLFTGAHYTPLQVTESVLAGLEASPEVPVRLILCVMRNSPIAHVENLINLYEKFHKRGVCGIDLAGDESRYACREYAPIYARAHELGIPITIHAGEAAGPASVLDAIDLFKAKRIGHGIRSIEDPKLVERLVTARIGVEVCLTSNLHTGNAATYEEHPFLQLRKAGVLVTLNTDDPSISGIDLRHEWARAREIYGLTHSDQTKILQNSVDVAFCDEKLKATLRQKVDNRNWF